MPFAAEKASVQDFQTLGLEPDARPEQVKKTYRDLVKDWHPDRFQQRSLLERQRAEERFKEITGAYRRISKGWKSRGVPGHASEGKRAAQRGYETKQPRQDQEEPKREETAQEPLDDPAGVFSVFFHARSQWRRRSARAKSFLGVLFCLILLLVGANWPSLSDWFFNDSSDLQRSTNAQPQVKKTLPPKRQMPDEKPHPDEKQLLQPQVQVPSRTNIPPLPPGETSAAHFTLGSSQDEVLHVQGPPTRTHGQTWVYGLSEVQFRDGRVWRYDNFDGSLKVHLQPPPDVDTRNPGFFTIGSTQHEVLLVQGTPTRLDANRWYFGFSEIRFRNGRVEEFDNYFGNLKIRILPSSPSNPAVRRAYFTIGSSRDEVLAAQGTPTSIQGNLWFYQLSNVLFREGKVQYVVDSAGNLRFVPPEEITGKEKQSE